MSPSAAHPSSVDFAQRIGVSASVGIVQSVERLSTSVVEVCVTSPLARELSGEPGNDVMVLVETREDHQIRRRYSVRDVSDEGTVTLWITTAHDGPGSRWVRELQIGDEVDVIGPRGKITLDPLADWHLFVGDISALGAFYRMAGALEAPGRAIFIIEVPASDDALIAPMPDGVGVTGIFVDRDDRRDGDPAGLLRGLAAFALPSDTGQAYVFGEFATGRVIRDALIDRGLEENQISLKAFWRAGVRNAEHGEPPKD